MTSTRHPRPPDGRRNNGRLPGSRNKTLLARTKRILGTANPVTGKLPGIWEIARMLNMPSTSVVDYHVRILENEGYIRREPHNGRVLQGTTYLTSKTWQIWQTVKIIGTLDEKGIHKYHPPIERKATE